MTEPRPIGELLAETLAAIRAMGPVLTRLELSRELYSELKRRAEAAVWGAQARELNAAWGTPFTVDDALPPWARREHYSDGRMVTRYRLVIDPRALRVAFRVVEYGGRRGQAAKRHALGLMVKRFGWEHVDVDPRGCTWEGQRVSPYLPGVSGLYEGLAARWMADYAPKTPRWWA